jgi:mRNA interferase RelE/StbE
MWQLEYTDTARKQLRKLDKPVAVRLLNYLRDQVAPLEDPRSIGKALRGQIFGAYWRYRIGDYRIVCDINDGLLTIVVVELGNRREIYR